MRISDWSSDVCSSDLGVRIAPGFDIGQGYLAGPSMVGGRSQSTAKWHVHWYVYPLLYWMEILTDFVCFEQARSEEHTSELQSLMRISYAVFCLKKKNIKISTK